MSDDERPAGPGGLLELPLVVLDEVVGVLPRLLDRTHRQVELARHLAGRLPCVGGLLVRPAPVPIPAHESVPIDVLQVVAEGGAEADGGSAGDASAAGGTGPSPTPEAEVPDMGELAVPDYDALSASQVVPRLATLAPEELEAVRRYERAHRNRQTILNKVNQLLGG